MPTLFRVGPYRVTIYVNDHTPAHVHAVGARGNAKFELGAKPGDVTLTEAFGIPTTNLKGIAAAIIDRHQECLDHWEQHHGDQGANRKRR